MKYLLGVDAGGTKADFLLTTLNGGPVLEFSTESANAGTATTGTAAAFDLGFKRLSGEVSLSDISHACLGVAGLHPGNHKKIDLQLRSALPSHLSETAIVVNDSVIGFHSAGKSQAGIALIAGTGSLSARISGERISKTVGGAGAKFSDKGSSYWIGKKTIQHLLETIELREPDQTLLLEFGIDVNDLEKAKWQLTELVNGFSQTEVAQVSKLTARLCQDHDWAQAIIESAADHLATLVIGLNPQEEEVVLIGSLLNQNQSIRNQLIKKLVDFSITFVPAPNPVNGAIALLQRRFAG